MDSKYIIVVFRDTFDGQDDYCYVAYHPELRGCMAQGRTVQEAVNELNDARADWMSFQLEDRLPVPPPKSFGDGDIININLDKLWGHLKYK